MCRFLMVRSKRKIAPAKFLAEFAGMCQQSRAPDGDWQGDGWGIATKYQISNIKYQKWEVYKSLKPIWEDVDRFGQFGETDTFVVHARSAGFPRHKGVIAYNQPYVRDGLAFVFNGMIRGVSLSMKVDGAIGAQKIFSLARDTFKERGMDQALSEVRRIIRQNARAVEGMNIGCVLAGTLYALCDYTDNSDYFSLRYYQDDALAMICSAPTGSYEWRTMRRGEILTI